MRTPITVAGSVISEVCDVFVRALGSLIEGNGEDAEGHFFEKIFKETWDDEKNDGDRQERDFFDEFKKNPDEVSRFAMLHAILIAISYSVQAMKAEKNSALAWSYASSASYWCGIIKATPFGYRSDGLHAASVMARRRHAENYALAEIAKKHWKDNIDPKLSAQKAASELIKVVPLSHKKLAEIVSQAKKEMSRD
ncbi:MULTISPECIES: hypothetical protein [Burkholderia]|uniref:hypothetical protein n=2 Tax=Burkholderiaceae TaxID=119060 RepID=UPI0021519945|nr:MULTISPECIES: hypothetical protein [Burkholderia]MDN7741599.1 hypothetical protein [Burkholderia gladioli]